MTVTFLSVLVIVYRLLPVQKKMYIIKYIFTPYYYLSYSCELCIDMSTYSSLNVAPSIRLMQNDIYSLMASVSFSEHVLARIIEVAA